MRFGHPAGVGRLHASRNNFIILTRVKKTIAADDSLLRKCTKKAAPDEAA